MTDTGAPSDLPRSDRPRSDLQALGFRSRLLAALLASVLIGVLTAALALPALGALGLAGKASTEEFLALPAAFTEPPLPQRTRILATDGSVIAWLYYQNRTPVPLSEIPPHTVQALLDTEDARFRQHHGVDVQGTLRAAVENATTGSVRQGGSTITQQYVKNARLAAATTPEEQQQAREQSITRKLREARLAMRLEQTLTKDQILERYFNIAYFGNGAYGIGAAANLYFSKPVRELTVAEGALLVGLLQNPARDDPLDRLPAAVTRRNLVLRRMADLGDLTPAGLTAALDETPDLRPSRIASGCEGPGVTAPFFCDYVRRALESGPLGAALGATREQRQQRLLAGGLTIRTTLNSGAQAAAQQALLRAVPAQDPSGVAATFTAVEPGTGQVRALAVNRAFGAGDQPGQTKLNLALGGSSGMQAGSTFKPFVLAAALEQGIPLGLSLQAPAEYASTVFQDCQGSTCIPYVVRNAGDSNAGLKDLVSGTQGSVNTFYVQLLERTGVDRPAQIAESLGLRQFAKGAATAPLHRGGSFVLGANEVSPLDLAAAYAAFAAGGKFCPPRPVVQVLDAGGQEIPLPPQTCTQALDPAIVATVTGVLRGNIDGTLPSRTGAKATIGRPAAGKTGSTDGSKAAWFAGFTPQIAATVWVGKPLPVELQNITIGGKRFAQVYGGSLPAPIWADAMSAILRGMPVVDLPPMITSATSVAPAP